jgi:hypothetical protein
MPEGGERVKLSSFKATDSLWEITCSLSHLTFLCISCSLDCNWEFNLYITSWCCKTFWFASERKSIYFKIWRAKGKQFLPPIRHPPYCSYSQVFDTTIRTQTQIRQSDKA